MKTLVCILGGYYPFFSPCGIIADNILQQLKKDYKIIVIAQRNDFSLKKQDEYNGIKIIRLNEWNRMISSLCERKIRSSSNRFIRAFYKVILLIKKLVFFAICVLRPDSVSHPYIRAVEKQLELIQQNEKIDILLPVSIPHEAVIAAINFHSSHPDIPVFPYQLDEFAGNNALYRTNLFSRNKRKRNLESEIKILENCRKLFVLPPISGYYKSLPVFSRFEDKIIVTEHPLVVKNELPQVEKAQKLTFVYAGALNIKSRNPDLVLSAFEILKSKLDFVFRIFWFGNCQAAIDKYKSNMKDFLYDGGRVPYEKASEEIARADFLVSIGNNSDTQVPSKLFTYLSYGKPIIHFYYNDKDPYISYLAKYEASLCLKITDVEQNADKLLEFCNEYSGYHLDFDEVVRIFRECTPEYTADMFKREFLG